MLQSPSFAKTTAPPPDKALMTTFINDAATVSTETRYLLVLDDYHIITTSAIHNHLAFLLYHMPPQIHLVIVSRSDPSLPLPRLRAQGLMAEIRVDDLRFMPQEAAAFLNTAIGLGLSDDDIAALESHTGDAIIGGPGRLATLQILLAG
jgi:LuxR family maltose regulon positive regulatory protein